MLTRRSILTLQSILLGFPWTSRLAWARGFRVDTGKAHSVDATTSESILIELLRSDQPANRTSATAEVFRRGTSILKALEAAGAKPMATISPPRIDVVYSLLANKLTGHFLTDSFGLHLNKGVTREAVAGMGKRHGFVLPDTRRVKPGNLPACYVELSPGKSLSKVLRSVLEREPSVITVNLNYFEN